MVPEINITIARKINKQTFCYFMILRVPDLRRTKQGIKTLKAQTRHLFQGTLLQQTALRSLQMFVIKI